MPPMAHDPDSPPDPLRLPVEWGPFTLHALVGSGGMGMVFRGQETATGREVAVKTVHLGPRPATETLQRLQREGRTGATLHHPGIVPVLDAGTVGTVPYLAMPFVHGCNLREAVARGRFPDRRARVTILRDVARAIGHAHTEKIIHRDLKPPNILIDEAGRAHVTDFGIAKRLEETSPLTAPGQLLGTVQYMPPEQIEGELDRIGPTADVYALGVVLYELLTGAAPFRGENFALVAVAVLSQVPPPPSRLDPTIPAELDALCARTLAKDPTERPPDGNALADLLDAWLEGRPAADPAASAPTRDPKGGWRRWFGLGKNSADGPPPPA